MATNSNNFLGGWGGELIGGLAGRFLPNALGMKGGAATTLLGAGAGHLIEAYATGDRDMGADTQTLRNVFSQATNFMGTVNEQYPALGKALAAIIGIMIGNQFGGSIGAIVGGLAGFSLANGSIPGLSSTAEAATPSAAPAPVLNVAQGNLLAGPAGP